MKTDPLPEDVGGVPATAGVDLLAAGVRNHVLLQGGVPVVMVHHTAAHPLERETRLWF